MEDRTTRTECKNERKKAIISTNRCDLNDFELNLRRWIKPLNN